MTTKTTITIIILTLLLILTGYIAYGEVEEYLMKERTKSYLRGFEDGKAYWNIEVIDTVNKYNKVPFILDDDTIQTIPIKQRCGE